MKEQHFGASPFTAASRVFGSVLAVFSAVYRLRWCQHAYLHGLLSSLLIAAAWLFPAVACCPQIQTLDIPGEVKKGYSPIGFVRCGRAACKITEIKWKVSAGATGLAGRQPSVGHSAVCCAEQPLGAVSPACQLLWQLQPTCGWNCSILSMGCNCSQAVVTDKTACHFLASKQGCVR